MSRRSLGVRVHKAYGENTIALAGKLKLLDRQFEIKRARGFVCVPLGKQPSVAELKELERHLGEVRVSTYVFQTKAEPAATLVDLLNGKLAPHFVASLPHSFDIVGDIAIVEIPPELEAYRTVVGEAILKLNKKVRTVLAKAGAVSGVYRLRELRIIAGEKNTATIHREYGCRYYVDLAKAYFSPRLSFEHHRVASLVRDGETVVDMFSGVGPFAIQIARTSKNVRVYAVDANPSAIEFLKKNVRLNKVEGNVVAILCDAKEAVRQRFSGLADRVIMNLPEGATKFICDACKALKPSGGTIHFYGFIEASDSLENVKARFAQAVEQCERRVEKVLFSRLVRATAPHEWQYVLDAKII
jgi:tRNA (guanine37-N1)-methyltransferase